MGTDVLKSSDSLQRELVKAKSQLQGLNENIRRIIGRDPQGTHLRGDRKRSFNDSRRSGEFNTPQHERPRRDSSPLSKRRPQEAKSVFSRLSGPPIRDDDAKPRIFSRVIRELPTRQEIVEAQGTDEVSRARNRRMFGCLMGTLQKFCQEESRLKPKEEKKAQIEKKLEEQELQERENLKKERQNLFSDRKRQQLEVRKLELKMNYIREFEIWEKSNKDLRNFIRTRTKSHIYYRPKVLTERAEKRLAESRAELDRELESRRNEMNDEIQAIENRFRLLMERIDHASYRMRGTDAPTKHDRHDEDDDDSLYGGQSDEDQNVDRIPSKVIDRNYQNRRTKDRHQEFVGDKLNDSTDVNSTFMDNTTLELDVSQRFDDEFADKQISNSSNNFSSGHKNDDNSD